MYKVSWELKIILFYFILYVVSVRRSFCKCVVCFELIEKKWKYKSAHTDIDGVPSFVIVDGDQRIVLFRFFHQLQMLNKV